MSRLHLLMLLVVGACTLPAAAAVYKWTDADGRIHYSDSPPPDRKAAQVEIKVNSISGPAVVSTVRGASRSTRSTWRPRTAPAANSLRSAGAVCR
jgi:hypothetical protein